MRKPIKVGDLVYVVRNHCPSRYEGTVATVTDLAFPYSGHCPACQTFFTACAAKLDDGRGWNPIQWLRRIPPIGELGDVQQKEDIRA